MIEPGDRVKVTDFGIAKVMESGDHLTMTGSLLGTPSYMSPEQAKGAALDGRSDLFAVGCILYEMMAGKKAFRGESITGLIFKIITEEPPPLRDMDPDVPEEMVRIIGRALAKTTDARYQTGRELADDLLALTRAGITPTLRQSETATAAGGPAPPAAPTILTPATIKGTAPADSVPTRIAARPAPGPPPPPPVPPPVTPVAARGATARAPAQPSSSKMGLIVALVAGGLFFAVLAAGAGWFFFLRKADPTVATTSGTVATPIPAESVPPADATVAPSLPPPTLAANNPAADPIPAPAAGQATPTRPATSSAPSRAENVAPVPPPVTQRPAPTQRAEASSDYAVLDEEGPPVDGREAGERLAGTYRQGGDRSGGSFGATGRFRARERSPRNLAPAERPAVATIRHLIDRMEAFHRRQNRYGGLADLRAAGLALDVPVSGNTFQRRGFQFELTVESDGFRVTATPLSPSGRSFVGDDSGYIREGVD
jgi:hypothetical protein